MTTEQTLLKKGYSKSYLKTLSDRTFSERFTHEDILLFEELVGKEVTVLSIFANTRVQKTFVLKSISCGVIASSFFSDKACISGISRNSVDHYKVHGSFIIDRSDYNYNDGGFITWAK